MGERFREFVKSIPVLGSVARKGRQAQLVLSGNHPVRSKSHVNLIAAMPAFTPNSGGTFRQRSPFVIDAVNGSFPALERLAQEYGRPIPEELDMAQFAERMSADPSHAARLKERFDHYGTDKSTLHDYHLAYAALLPEPDAVRGVLEIGIGSKNLEIVSHMEAPGPPGASLRAFRDYLPSATIYGADIDRDILISDDRISCFYVDQTDPASVDALGTMVPTDLHLVIDDGLHSPHANLHALTLGLRHVRPGGWVVIEDINQAARPIWRVATALLPPERFAAYLVAGQASYMYLVQRLA